MKEENSIFLSVIIPVYQAERWLEECLESILASVGKNLDAVEVILVDDGSTDASAGIIDRYAGQYSNFRAIHQKNGGVAAARNTGLALATGRYLAWVDPDDRVAGDWYASIFRAARSEPDIILMDSVRFDGQTAIPECYGRSPGAVDRDLFYADLVRDVRLLSGLPNKVMKASLYCGIRFDPALPILEDYGAILDIAGPARSVVYIPEALYHYRQHSGSLLHQVDPERAFFSVEMALRRYEQVPPAFQKAAVTAVMVQILAFLYNRKADPDFLAQSRQLTLCHKLIRRHLAAALSDSELSARKRAKLVYLALLPRL